MAVFEVKVVRSFSIFVEADSAEAIVEAVQPRSTEVNFNLLESDEAVTNLMIGDTPVEVSHTDVDGYVFEGSFYFLDPPDHLDSEVMGLVEPVPTDYGAN